MMQEKRNPKQAQKTEQDNELRAKQEELKDEIKLVKERKARITKIH